MCAHMSPYGEVQDGSGIDDTQMIPSASFNTCCAPALIKLWKIAFRTDREIKISLFKVAGGKISSTYSPVHCRHLAVLLMCKCHS